MYRSIDEFCADFAEDMAEMGKNFAALTDAALDTRARDGHFSLRELAAHIVNAWPGVLAQAGKPWQFELLADTADAATIFAAFNRLKDGLPVELRAHWRDEELLATINMWGMDWTHAKLLHEMHKHTLHHHGQMTVLLRLAGLPVHGLFGPSADEAKPQASEA
jgi:uncharacterized damage-inducible protein DinB